MIVIFMSDSQKLWDLELYDDTQTKRLIVLLYFRTDISEILVNTYLLLFLIIWRLWFLFNSFRVKTSLCKYFTSLSYIDIVWYFSILKSSMKFNILIKNIWAWCLFDSWVVMTVISNLFESWVFEIDVSLMSIRLSSSITSIC